MFRDAVLKAAADAIEHLGEPVILPGGEVVQGVFSYPAETTEISRGQRDIRASVSMPARDPMLSLRETDAVTLARGAAVTVRGRQFDVTDRFPTGNGLVRLTLTETQASEPAGTTTWR